MCLLIIHQAAAAPASLLARAVPAAVKAASGPAFAYPAAVEGKLLGMVKQDKARLQNIKVETQK